MVMNDKALPFNTLVAPIATYTRSDSVPFQPTVCIAKEVVEISFV